MKGRLLIISSGNPSRNPRPVKEAACLASAGHEVTLLVPPGDAALHAEDDALAHTGGFRLQRVGRPPGLAARLSRWLAARAVPLGFHSPHALGAHSDLLKASLAAKADLTIVHNEIPHWIGTRLLAQGRCVAADFEDWYSEDLPLAARRHRPLRLLQRIEHQLLHQASYCSTTSQSLASALQTRHRCKQPLVLPNAFPLQAAPDPAILESSPSFFWFSQTIGPGRGLESFLAVWRLCSEPSRLVLLGSPQEAYLEKLFQRLSSRQRERVSVLPLVPGGDLPALIAKHTLGLALEDASIPSRDLTVTNKLLQYLNAGLAVVASHTSGQHEVLDHSPSPGIFLDFVDPQADALRLDHLLADKAQLLALRLASRRLAEGSYNWECFTHELRQQVRSVLEN